MSIDIRWASKGPPPNLPRRNQSHRFQRISTDFWLRDFEGFRRILNRCWPILTDFTDFGFRLILDEFWWIVTDLGGFRRQKELNFFSNAQTQISRGGGAGAKIISLHGSRETLLLTYRRTPRISPWAYTLVPVYWGANTRVWAYIRGAYTWWLKNAKSLT